MIRPTKTNQSNHGSSSLIPWCWLIELWLTLSQRSAGQNSAWQWQRTLVQYRLRARFGRATDNQWFDSREILPESKLKISIPKFGTPKIIFFNYFQMISVPKFGGPLHCFPSTKSTQWIDHGIPTGITEATQGPILKKCTAGLVWNQE